MLKLWWCAWKQYPAGSLPNDDRVLAQLAGYEMAPKAWAKIRSATLRGWVICSDQLLYHPVVSELAIKAMGKREGKAETENAKTDRQRRWRERLRDLSNKLRELGVTPPRGASLETLERLLVDASPSTNTSTVDGCSDGVEIGITLQETTVDEKEEESFAPLTFARDREFFDRRFMAAYPNQADPDAAFRAWLAAIQTDDPEKIIAGISVYPWRDEVRYRPKAARWLNDGGWKTRPDVAAPVVKSPADPKIEAESIAKLTAQLDRLRSEFGDAINGATVDDLSRAGTLFAKSGQPYGQWLGAVENCGSVVVEWIAKARGISA